MNRCLRTVLSLLVAVGVAAPLVAQGPGGPPPAPGQPGVAGAPGGGDVPAPPEDVLKTALALTDDQVASLQKLLDMRRQAVQAVMTQLATAQKALADALKATSPDATQLGTMLLTIKSCRDQISQADKSVAASFRAVLDTDQQALLFKFVAMKDSLPILMVLQRLGF